MTQRHLAVLTLEVTMLDGRRPDRHLLPAAQPPGRQGRVPRRQPMPWARATDPRKAGAFDRPGACEPRLHYAREDRMMLGYQCASSRMTHRGRRPTTGSSTDDELRDGPARATRTSPRWSSGSRPREGTHGPAGQSWSPTTPRAASRSASCSDRCDRTLDRATAARRRPLPPPSSAQWFDDFWAASDVEVRRPRGPTRRAASSRPSASTSSAWPRPARAPTASACRRRA